MLKLIHKALIAALVIIPSSTVIAQVSLQSRNIDQIAVYAMMASNAYADDVEKTYFSLEKLGWRKVDENGEGIDAKKNSYSPKTFLGAFFSNLQFDIWEDANSNRTIFAFKGTKEKIDWTTGNLMLGVSIPYKSAKKHVREYIKKHPQRVVSLSGHSLGGGLALSVSFWEGVDAVVFNSSPRVFDGTKGNNKPAERIAIFQEDDILQKVRLHHPIFLKKISSDQVTETHFDYSGRNSHRSDLLAEGILACSNDPALKEFANSINLSVRCYLD